MRTTKLVWHSRQVRIRARTQPSFLSKGERRAPSGGPRFRLPLAKREEHGHAEFVYLPALSHKPNPIRVMTSKTINAATIR